MPHERSVGIQIRLPWSVTDENDFFNTHKAITQAMLLRVPEVFQHLGCMYLLLSFARWVIIGEGGEDVPMATMKD